jgi:hypothetical protein
MIMQHIWEFEMLATFCQVIRRNILKITVLQALMWYIHEGLQEQYLLSVSWGLWQVALPNVTLHPKLEGNHKSFPHYLDY